MPQAFLHVDYLGNEERGPGFPMDPWAPCYPGQSCSEAGSLRGWEAGLGVGLKQGCAEDPCPLYHWASTERDSRPTDWESCPTFQLPGNVGPTQCPEQLSDLLGLLRPLPAYLRSADFPYCSPPGASALPQEKACWALLPRGTG